jgi:hypothetical protein
MENCSDTGGLLQFLEFLYVNVFVMPSYQKYAQAYKNLYEVC